MEAVICPIDLTECLYDCIPSGECVFDPINKKKPIKEILEMGTAITKIPFPNHEGDIGE